MTTRLLSEKDIEYIVSVQQGNFADGWNSSMLKSAFEEGRFYALAIEEDDLPVGLVTFSVALDTADIEGVVVVSDKRLKGYGLKLVETAELKMRELGVVKSFLEVRESNYSAQALYNKAGYSQISIRKNYYSDGENAIVMVKELV